MIGFDIDGVVADFNGIFRRVVLDEVGYDINNSPQDQFKIVIPGMSDAEVFKLVCGTIRRFVYEMQPYPGTPYALWKLYSSTREPIRFVTARRLITKEATERWLKEYIVVPSEVAYVRSADKCSYLKEHGFTHFVDDRYRTVQQVKQCVPHTYLMNRPWNEGRVADGVYRINDLNDYVTDYLQWRNINEQINLSHT